MVLLQLTVTWYKIHHAGEQVTHWDILNKENSSSLTGWSNFVSDVPLRSLLSNSVDFVPRDRKLQRAHPWPLVVTSMPIGDLVTVMISSSLVPISPVNLRPVPNIWPTGLQRWLVWSENTTRCLKINEITARDRERKCCKFTQDL